MFRQFVRSHDHHPPAPAAKAEAPAARPAEPAAARPATVHHLAAGRRGDFWTDLKVRLHQRLLEMLNLAAIDKVPVESLRREVATMIRELLAEEGVALNAKEYYQLVEEVLDEVLGLGPLEPLLKDATVSDVLVNTHKQVFVERHGRLEVTQVQFKDDDHLLRIIDKIVSRVGRRIDESAPGSTPGSPTGRGSTPSSRPARWMARCSRSASSPRCR
jgi:pilus assembly protein CpaF